jgi:hypothetical protein
MSNSDHSSRSIAIEDRSAIGDARQFSPSAARKSRSRQEKSSTKPGVN